MHASYDDYTRFNPSRGPSVYYGYCGRTNRYRMMDLPDFMTNVQQGMSRMMADAQAAYQDLLRGYSAPGGYRGERGGVSVDPRGGWHHDHGCGCHEPSCRDCHCDCCVGDTDVLVHARCGEVRRIPVTFSNDSRRERDVKLTLEKFVSSGGRDLQWKAALSEAEFTLKACDDKTVIVSVLVRCDTFSGGGDQTQPNPDTKPGTDPNLGVNRDVKDRLGSVDRCEVGYATLRAEGCLTRPAVIAVAVLPDSCDAYNRPCSCGCCH
jgi:hypothetical protein